MAENTLVSTAHGVVELNRCSFLHDGNIESQCSAAAAMDNGLVVKVDKAAGTVSTVANYTAAALYGLNYTTEKIYNDYAPARKNFYVAQGEYPRVGILKAGDIFTTTAYAVDYTATATSLTNNTLYITGPSTVATSAPAGIKLQVVAVTDVADGSKALKIQVL